MKSEQECRNLVSAVTSVPAVSHVIVRQPRYTEVSSEKTAAEGRDSPCSRHGDVFSSAQADREEALLIVVVADRHE